MLSHDTWKNMKRIGIKGSHLAFFFNFGGRDSLKMIYKANYFIFPFNMIIGGRGEGENFLSLLKFRIQTGHPKETKAVCLHLKVPASPPRLPGSRAPTAPRSWPWSCSEGAESLSRVRLLVTPRTVARQPPLSMGFSRQEHWSGLLCPPPGGLPDPGIKPTSLPPPSLAGGGGRGGSLPLVPPGSRP